MNKSSGFIEMFAGGQKISGSMAQKGVSWRPIPHEMEESPKKMSVAT